jgi:hypothetical protein
VVLAGRQHSVFSLAQAVEIGFSPGAVHSRARRGRFHRIHQGVYAIGRADLTRHGRFMAAVLACGPGAVLSHLAAAVLHALLRHEGTSIDVSHPSSSVLSRPGLSTHRRPELVAADLTEVDGIPCTSVARTLLDVAATEPRAVLESACDQAEVERVFDMRAVEELLARSRGHRGVRALREATGAGPLGEDLPRRELEQRFLALCKRDGLPMPAVNTHLLLGGEYHEIDFVWRAERLVAETDGYRYHSSRGAFRRDRRRDQQLELEGWRHVRFTWDQVRYDPSYVLHALRRLLSPPSVG